MAKITLTEARVRALRSRKTAYDTRDGKLKAFGVRVLPSGGKRFFIHCQHRGERIWKIVGATNAMGLAEARKRAATMLAAIRRGREPLASAENVVFENVADEVFHRYALRWKPGTLRVNRCYLRNQILPLLRRAPDRGHRQAGCPRLVRLPARDTGRRRQVDAGAIRHHGGG